MKSFKMRVAGALGAGVILLSGSTAAFAHELTTPAIYQNGQAGQATFGNLIAALNNVNAQIDRLNALNDLTVSQVRVVNVEDVLNGNNVQALNNALNRNQTNVQVLQDFLNGSVNNNNVNVIRDALNQNNIDVSRVVAIDVLSGGDVTVFRQ